MIRALQRRIDLLEKQLHHQVRTSPPLLKLDELITVNGDDAAENVDDFTFNPCAPEYLPCTPPGFHCSPDMQFAELFKYVYHLDGIDDNEQVADSDYAAGHEDPESAAVSGANWSHEVREELRSVKDGIENDLKSIVNARSKILSDEVLDSENVISDDNTQKIVTFVEE